MNKGQLLTKINRAWDQLVGSYAGLSPEQMRISAVTGDWSVQDILAHVTVWEQEALKYLPLIINGGRPPRYRDLYGGLDAFNALKTEENRGMSLDETLSRFERTHQELIAFVESVPEAQIALETPFRHRLRLDTYSHYPIHARAILEWRSATGYSPANRSQMELPGLGRNPQSP